MDAFQLVVLCSLISKISADPQVVTEEEQLYITEESCDFQEVINSYVRKSNMYVRIY